MAVLIDAEEAFGKSPLPFMINTTKKLGREDS